MKRLFIGLFALFIVILSYLLTPTDSVALNDGGTVIVDAPLYSIYFWHRIIAGENGKIEYYDKAEIIFYPECERSVDELWAQKGSK